MWYVHGPMTYTYWDLTYVTDLVLCLLQPLHLRRVGHHAEAFPPVLLKVLLVKSLKVRGATSEKHRTLSDMLMSRVGYYAAALHIILANPSCRLA